MAVTRDALSGRWVPATAAEFTTLLTGTGISNPSFLWLCQEAAGNLADSIGACTLTAANAPGYNTAVSGWTRKAVSWADLSTSRFDNTVTPPNGNASSLLFFGYMYVSATPGGARYFMSMTDWAINLFVNGSGQQGLLDNSAGTGTTVISDGVPRPFLVVYNRTAGTCKLYTPTETLDGGYVSSAGVHIALGAFPGLNTPSGGCLYAFESTGAAAELSAGQAAILLDRMMNGPAVTSVSVTPAPSTVPVSSTVQLTATATRADGTTFDCTSTATWSSGAPATATVSSSGLVSGVSMGSAVITATYTSLGATPAPGTSSLTVGAAVNNWPYTARLPEFRVSVQRAGFVEVVLSATPASAEWTALDLMVSGNPSRAPSRNRS